jgi:hypothetical protein
MSKIVNRTNHTLTLDRVPTDLQGTDVMFMSASGKRRGRRNSLWRFIECVLVLLLGFLAVWPFARIALTTSLRLTVIGFTLAVLWGGLMGYLLGRDLKGGIEKCK